MPARRKEERLPAGVDSAGGRVKALEAQIDWARAVLVRCWKQAPDRYWRATFMCLLQATKRSHPKVRGSGVGQ